MEATAITNNASHLMLYTQDILRTLEVTHALDVLAKLSECLDSINVSQGQVAGRYFLASVIDKVADEIEAASPNDTIMEVLEDVRFLASTPLKALPEFRTDDLRAEIEGIESLTDYRTNHGALAKMAANTTDGTAELLRVKLTGLMLDEIVPALNLNASPALQIFRDIRMCPPELWPLSLYFLDFDIHPDRFRLTFPNLLTDLDSMDVINAVAFIIANIGPELPLAVVEALVKPLEAVLEERIWALERERYSAGLLNAAFADVNAKNSLAFWESDFMRAAESEAKKQLNET